MNKRTGLLSNPGRIAVAFILIAIIAIAAKWLYTTVFNNGKIKNVLLISIDTCRSDYLSCYGYKRKTTPNIDAIADEGILFENVFSTTPLTLPAHSSMLTGTVPPYHGVHDNFDYQLDESNVTLAEILKKNGFTTGAAISAVVLDSDFGTNQGFDTYNDDFENLIANNSVEQRRGDETTKVALDWLNENKDKKFFYFLHYYDPHMNYEPPEPFAFMFATNPYAGEIAYVDYCIGQVIQNLKELKLYKSTLIIITADHGEMLGEHGESSHGYFIYQSSIKVPLIFKLPGRNKSVRIKSITGIVDIVPTVCSLLGIDQPQTMHGKDLSASFSGTEPAKEDRHIYCESMQATMYNANSLLGLVNDRFKYIQTTRPELYDLTEDPAEKDNLTKKQPQQARIMKDKLAQILEQSVRKGSADSKMEIDGEMRKRLESLGYVGDGITEDFSFDQTKEDPKDALYYHLLNIAANDCITSQKNYEKAKILAEKMIQLKPDCVVGYKKMSTVAIKLENYPEAIDSFNKAMKIKPDDASLYNDAAVAYHFLEKYDEAIRLCRRTLELDPDYESAHHNLGAAFEAKGQIEEAEKHFRKAIDIEPDFPQSNHSLGNILKAKGKIDEAIKCYQTALRKEPEMAEAHFNLGILHLSMKHLPEEAFTNFQNALQYNPDFANTIVAIADKLAKKERTDRAIALIELILEKVPDCSLAHYNLGLILTKTGKTDQAAKNFKKAISLQPDDARYLNSLAWILATNPKSTTQEIKEAIKLASRAVKLTDGKIAQPVDTLAAAYAATGDFTKAIENAEKAIELAGDDEDLKKEINGRIKLYKANRPYRQP